ncbi:type IV pilus secretin PilQ [Vibrio salilacus]|uniref:type IV pilus secretin PilQ n=1 Tax=Vibrio salilacus TaxID=1323749 RepID=UPI000C29D604|nr:type IV pilus secretin PilQ [Vibrio salilacus]
MRSIIHNRRAARLRGVLFSLCLLLITGWVSQLSAAETTNNQAKLSFNFQDISVRDALRVIAQSQNINIAIDDSVSGQLTLSLTEVTWQQALDTVVEVKGLTQHDQNGVMLIRSKQLSIDAGSELSSELIAVNYASADQLMQVLLGSSGFNLLSEHGALGIDERTNVLLIRDYPEHITATRKMVALLDVPIKQVQIEARIVTINQGNLEELGVRWGLSHVGHRAEVGGSIEGIRLDSATIDQMLNINLAAQAVNASSIAFQVAKLGSDTLLDLELSAMQRESKAEVISSPSLMTTNKKPAYIEQGTEIPYLESSSSGATNVAFKKAVLSLKVTPQITPGDHVLLDLNVTQDRPGEVVNTGTGEAVAIDTQRIGTQVLVKNGETIVLGGIFQHSVFDSVDKVPLLGDLPLLGGLFRRTYQKIGKRELVIFVTPNVIIESEIDLERK